MRLLLTILGAALTVVYPLLVWWGLERYRARTIALVGLVVLVASLVSRVFAALPSSSRQPPGSGPARESRVRERLGHLFVILRVPLVIVTMLALAALLDDARLLELVPVAINVALLFTFGLTLRGEVSMIERFARLQDPDLGAPQQAHCRQFTKVWTVFFTLNAAVTLALALAAPRRWWATYTGGVAYGLMGLLFAGEYLLRHKRFREYRGGPLDPLLKRLFPPHDPGLPELGAHAEEVS